MVLTIYERLVLSGMLAQHSGSFTTLKLVREARETLSLTDEEQAVYQTDVAENGSVKWRTHDDDGKEIPQGCEIKLGETVLVMIKKDLENLDKKELLKDEHYSLYEKFVLGGVK